jgi:hypothetical protein
MSCVIEGPTDPAAAPLPWARLKAVVKLVVAALLRIALLPFVSAPGQYAQVYGFTTRTYHNQLESITDRNN